VSLTVTGAQDRVKGEGAEIDGVRGVTVGTDRHRQHWEVAVRLSLKNKKREVWQHSVVYLLEENLSFPAPGCAVVCSYFNTACNLLGYSD
jgi:hypothetical protein